MIRQSTLSASLQRIQNGEKGLIRKSVTSRSREVRRIWNAGLMSGLPSTRDFDITEARPGKSHEEPYFRYLSLFTSYQGRSVLSRFKSYRRRVVVLQKASNL